MGIFETSLKVRFSHVDYAGIMFYPRFFENFHAVFEDMFTERLGLPYTDLLGVRRIGFPTVHIETDFNKPFRFGETMRLVLDVVKLGRTSIKFRYRGYNAGDPDDSPSVSAIGTVVTLHLDTFETMPIPDDIRAVLIDLLADDA